MPSPTTAGDVINSALRLGNLKGIDQTLNAVQISESLDALNDLIEQWNTDDLSLYDSPNQTFTLIPGHAMHTIGTGGDFNVVRPVSLYSPMYTTINGTSFICKAMTQEEYNLIAVKGQTQPYPERYLYVNDYPLGQITFWPTPDTANPITISMGRVLTNVTSQATVMAFPPGYTKAFKYMLHCDLAPLFGKEPKPSVAREATRSYAAVKKSNKHPIVSQMDPALLNYGFVPWQRGY